jgi:hypothetical protein
VAVAALLAAVGLTARAQPRGATGVGAVDGIVTDTNLVALGNAIVSVLGSGVHVTTTTNGRFRIVSLPAGSYYLVVHRVGYVPISVGVQVAANDTLRASFTMSPIANVLDTVITTAKRLTMRLEEFESRRTAGFGTFLTQVDIEKRQAVVFGDLLRAIPSVYVAHGRMFEEFAASTRSGGCYMNVYVDNVLLPRPTNLFNLPSPKDVAAIEIYPGSATVPLQYKSANSGCGVILIWTRGGD